MDKNKRILFIIIIIYFVLITAASSFRHYSFNSNRDLGVFEQSFYHTLEGCFFCVGVKDVNAYMNNNNMMVQFFVHPQFILFLLLPIYYFIPSTYLLLAVQALIVAFSAYPLFLLGKKLFNSRFALIISTAYLLNPILWSMNLSDFYPVAFSNLFIFFMILFYLEKKNNLFFLSLFLLLLTKETNAIFTLMLGIVLFIKDRKWIFSKVILISVAWILIFFIAIPKFLGANGYFYLKGTYNVSTLPELVKSIITNPFVWISKIFSNQALNFGIDFLKPLAFLPLLSYFIIIAIPYFLMSALATDNVFITQIFYHEYYIILAVLFISLLFSIKRNYFLRKHLKVIGLIILIATLISHFSVNDYKEVMSINGQMNFQELQQLHKEINNVSPETLVYTDNYFFSHFIKHKNIVRISSSGELSGSFYKSMPSNSIAFFMKEDRWEQNSEKIGLASITKKK